VRALLANPLVRQWDRAAPLLDALLEANRPHLPQFFDASGTDADGIDNCIGSGMLDRTGLADVTVVQNDTFAVLWAGASRPWGIAVVAGAGINAVGMHPSGRTARFLALGDYTGDVGGGHHIGVRALAAAIRARDGRGRATVLTAAEPECFGLRRPEDVAIAVHLGAVRHEDLHVLAPAVFAAATAGDAVAARIIASFADEVALMVGALARRLRLVRTDVEVVLGGGTLQTNDGPFRERVVAGIVAELPRAQVRLLDLRPVFGAVAEALRRAGASTGSLARARRALGP
jgi:N-acetylglucosamine kinase-like BadF-type ATPase